MKLKNFLIRFLFCLLFVAVVFYIRSYNGELINNTQVQWQYLQDDKGKVFLALDVYSPSGIKVDSVFSDDKEVTDYWQLINYPDWYKGKENLKKIGEFQEILHPYLPYNKDFDILYTTGWYTFLYKWNPSDSLPIPPENSIEVRYQNMGTQNYYDAEYALGARVISQIAGKTVDGPVIDLQIFYPQSSSHKYSDENKPKVVLDNLVPRNGSLGYVLEDLGRDDYSVCVRNRNGEVVDSLKGFVKWNSKKVYHVYFKTHGPEEGLLKERVIDFKELSLHFAAVVFMVYFVLICRYVGQLFVKWRGIVLDSCIAKLVIPAFLGFVFLTYLFFAIGIFKLLYLPVVFFVLLIILFFGYESSSKFAFYIKEALINECRKLRAKSWRVVFLMLLLVMLFYNFSFCFVPSTVLDGSTDITSNYYPLLDHYIREHSFKAPVQNSYVGLLSQSGDILRTVVKMFAGELGVLLLSFTFLFGILSSIYLVCKKIFNVKSMLIYLSLILFLSSNIFVEVIHFGKIGTVILSFYLIAMYSLRYSEHEKNYILISLFFAFVASQYAFFAVPVLIFYFFAIKLRKQNQLYKKGLVFFLILSSLFYVKLIIENGVCFPPGLIPGWLADCFLKFNQNNEFYKYIDNNYIRVFHKLQNAVFASTKQMAKIVDTISDLSSKVVFGWTVVLIPFMLKSNRNRNKRLYLFMSFLTVFYFSVIINNPRIFVYGLFVILPLQAVVIDKILSYIKPRLRVSLYMSVIVIMVFLLLFDIVTMKIRNKGYWYTNLKSNAEGIRYDAWSKYILPVFCGLSSKYEYLYNSGTSKAELNQVPYYLGYLHENEGLCQKNFDYAMLIRSYTDISDVILIVPELFHGYSNRTMTARNALGSVVFQRDVDAIMSDLKALNINYLSIVTADKRVNYNRIYTPIFEKEIFYKYFKILFSYNGRRFYKIIHNGTNNEYTPSPYDMDRWPFVPMIKTEKE